MWTVLGHSKAVTLFDRARRQDCLAHSYLLVGPAGVGKKTLALDLARAVNCSGPEPPCGLCRSCQRVTTGKHADVRIISKDMKKAEDGSPRKEISIDDIKQLQTEACLPPFEGRRKVFIIEGADHLSLPAANCLLKTLEEPPAGVIIILLTAREDRLLSTVVSRCQRLDLLPLAPAVLEALLVERGLAADRARLLARLSRGCPGWALTAAAGRDFLDLHSRLLEELIEVADSGLEKRFAEAARMASRFQRQRETVDEALDLWLCWWRDLFLVKAGASDFVTNVDRLGLLQEKARLFSLQDLWGATVSLQEARKQLEWNANARLVLEVLMLQIPGINK